MTLTHVKPHGALYNQAARDARIASAIVAGLQRHTPGLAVFAPAGSALLTAALEAGLRGVREAFADRAYLADGRLVPRDQPGAVISDHAAVVARASRLVREGLVTAVTGETIAVPCDTICVHADTPGAAGLARGIREALAHVGVRISAPGVG